MTRLRPPAHPENFRVKVGRYGDRWYIDNLPADDNWDPMTDPVPSVTAVKGSWPKFLTNWAAGEVAAFAVDNLESWQNLDRAAAVDLLSKAHNRSRDASAARGTSIHAAIEGLAEHGQIPMMELVGLDDYRAILQQLADDLQPEFIASEVVAIKRGDDGYGGTPDAIATLNGHGTRVIDWKSRKPGKGGAAYPDEFCQGEAYRTADYLIVGGENGEATRAEVPATDGVAVVTIEPEAYCVCVPDDPERLAESWVTLRRFWNVQKLHPVKSVRATQQIAAADRPQPDPSEAGVEVTVEDTTTTGGPSPDPERLAWFTARYDEVREAAGPNAIKAAWPENLSTPAHRNEWTAEQLDRACEVIQKLHHRQGLDFAPQDPQAAKLRRKPRTTETKAGDDEHAETIAAYRALPQERQDRVLGWQAQGNRVGRSWEAPSSGATRWAITVNRAAIGLASHTNDDDIARAWISLVIGDDDAQTFPPGALLGSLTVTEAQQLAELTQLDTFAAAIAQVDEAA